MKMSAMLIAAVVLSASAPAFAAARGNDSTPKLTYDAKRDKYCVSQTVTGQLLPVKDCRSKEEWAQAGLKIGDQSAPAKLASK